MRQSVLNSLPNLSLAHRYFTNNCTSPRSTLRGLVFCPFTRSLRLASSASTNRTFKVPIGNNGHVSLNVTLPAISVNQVRPNVIIYLPPGPLFQRFGLETHDTNVHKDNSISDISPCQNDTRNAELSHALASITSSTVVTINYRLGTYESVEEQSASALGSILNDDKEGKLESTMVQSQLHYRYPTPVHDTLAGFDWVVQNLQPAHLGVMGTHIGGSLALMLALTEAQSVRAVAAVEPVCDWTGLDEYCMHSDNGKEANSRKKAKGVPTIAPRDLVSLLGNREALFTSPERYFDAFASPILFLRSPGKDVPNVFPKYLTGPEYPVPVLQPTESKDRGEVLVDLWDISIHPDEKPQPGLNTIDARGSAEPDLDFEINPTDGKQEDRVVRRRKALSRWPPYGLDYGVSGATGSYYNKGVKRLEMTLPRVRLFVREDDTVTTPTVENQHPNTTKRTQSRSPKKAQHQTVLAQQANEMVDTMRRACFWGKEKGFGENRVTISQLRSEPWPASGEQEAGRWLDDVLELD